MPKILTVKGIKEQITSDGKFDYHLVIQIGLDPDEHIVGSPSLEPAGGDAVQPIELILDVPVESGSGVMFPTVQSTWVTIQNALIGNIRDEDLLADDIIDVHTLTAGHRSGKKNRYRLKDSLPD